MSVTFTVYIDESGDEGFSFGKGSSDWFVLSAVIIRKVDDLQSVELVKYIRSQTGKKGPLHFREMRHERRLPFVDTIAKAKLRAVSVLVHKPSLREPETFQERFRLYFYIVRYLLERVSWYCRDHKTHHDSGDGSAEIFFSNRKYMSYNELRDYLERLKKLDVRIEWSVIKTDQIKSYPASKRAGLQIADAVAGSFFFALEPRHGFTEDRYAKMLKPVVYQRGGLYLGYGLKFWPREVDSKSKDLEWVRSAYE